MQRGQPVVGAWYVRNHKGQMTLESVGVGRRRSVNQSINREAIIMNVSSSSVCRE